MQDVVKKLNIQIDNLCQFLPQDKVSNFAALSPQELLRETEKAVGSEAMLNMHDKLVDLRKRVKELDLVRHLILCSLQQTCNDHKKHLQDLEKSQEGVKRDVLRFQEREKHLKKVEDLKKKRPWIEFEDQRVKALAAREERDAAAKAFEAYDAEKRAPLVHQLKKAEEKLREVEKQRSKVIEKLKAVEKERTHKNDQFERAVRYLTP